MDLRFHTLDVFTDRTFGGNPLGVFPDAAHLPTDLMQRIAREMNLSESVFLGPPETSEGTARVRIFTPGREVPFAGHPTVGSAIFLAARGDADAEGGESGGSRGGSGAHEEISGGKPRGAGAHEKNPGGTPGSADAQGDSSGAPKPPTHRTRRIVLEENVGPVPVVVRLDEGGAPVFAQFTTALPSEHRPAPHTPEQLASMISVDAGEIRTDGLTPEMVSCGLPYYVIPVRSLETVRRSFLDIALWRSLGVATCWADHVYVICMDGEGDGVDCHVRMYAPGSGVPEDPATGSAAAALGGYLARADGRRDGTLAWTVEQGLEIGRPSVIHVEADREGGRTTAIRVGGSAVFVSEGVMRVPHE